MQDLQKTLDDHAGHDVFPEVNLLALAKRWAAYCLERHSDATLDKGLEISKALANYHYETHIGAE